MESNSNFNLKRRTFIGSCVAGFLGISGCLGESSNLFLPIQEWSFDAEGIIRASPVVSGNSVYMSSFDGNIYALRGESDNEGVLEDYSMFKGNLSNTNSFQNAGPEGEIDLEWVFDTGGRIQCTPAVVDGDIYFGSEDGNFYSVSANDGKENWSFDAGGLVGGSCPTIIDEVVYFGYGYTAGSEAEHDDSGGIYALDAQNGEEIWSVDIEGGVQSPTVVNKENELLYHGCHDNKFYARSLNTGEEDWSFEADGVICGCGAALMDGVIYVGSEDNSMYALDADDGSLVWEFETGDIIVSSPVATEEAVYFGSHDGNLYAVEPETGEEIWRFETDWSIFSSPAYKDGVVYVGSTDYNMYAIDAETGEGIWSYGVGEKIHSSPVVTEDMVYFGTDDGKIKAIRNVPVDEKNYEEWLEENPIESSR